MAKQASYVNNSGAVIVKTGNIFNARAKQTLEAILPGAHYHMRVGRFSVVAAEGDLLAAEIYGADNLDHRISRDSEFFARSRRDRLSQLARISAAIRPSHPLFAQVMADVASEREYLA